MSTATTEYTTRQSTSKSILSGAIAGIGGGIVFGIMMAMMGILPMVGMLIGQESAAIGFIVHLAISALIGATFGLIVTRLPSVGTASATIAGAVYGIVWWVLGALILMPLLLGMSQMVLAIGGTQWLSLLGHLIFGVIMGALFLPLGKRL